MNEDEIVEVLDDLDRGILKLISVHNRLAKIVDSEAEAEEDVK